MKKLLFCYGTRPEIVKLSPVIRAATGRFEIVTVFSGQHTSLYDDVKDLVPEPTYKLSTRRPGSGLTEFMCSFGSLVDQVVRQESPDLVVVQGDTATAYMTAVISFQAGLKVGHVEAGLRTNDIHSPFPEEFYRQSISRLASINWCPTNSCVNSLQSERVTGKVVLTGNTIVDMVESLGLNPTTTNRVIVTLHRRENYEKFRGLVGEINQLALHNCAELEFLFPAHPSPRVQEALDAVTAHNFHVVKPMGYRHFLKELASCKFIISDSGGLQEEACCLGKKVLVCRHNTERPEALWYGYSKLVADAPIRSLLPWAYAPVPHGSNPFGNGTASESIVRSMEEFLV